MSPHMWFLIRRGKVICHEKHDWVKDNHHGLLIHDFCCKYINSAKAKKVNKWDAPTLIANKIKLNITIKWNMSRHLQIFLRRYWYLDKDRFVPKIFKIWLEKPCSVKKYEFCLRFCYHYRSVNTPNWPSRPKNIRRGMYRNLF